MPYLYVAEIPHLIDLCRITAIMFTLASLTSHISNDTKHIGMVR